jgi:N4-gp56 family major capsid protein
VALQTTGSSGTSAQFQPYLNKKLLKYAKQKLVMDQFAKLMPYPKDAGATSIKFFRPRVGDRTNVQTLSEGIPISTFTDNSRSSVTFTLTQYGQASKISDIMTYLALFDELDSSVEGMGTDAALHLDYVLTAASVPNVAAGNKHYSGGAANFNALNALTAAQGAMTIVDLLWASTRLTLSRAPEAKGGGYVAVVCPQLGFDLMQDAKFVDSGKYGATKGLYNGEIGMWYGIRIVVTTAPWTEAGTDSTEGTFGTGGTGGTIYSTMVIGQEAIGAPVVAGNSPFDPKIVINDKPDKSDPLNQFVTAGWKAHYAAGVLKNDWFVINRSKSTFA